MQTMKAQQKSSLKCNMNRITFYFASRLLSLPPEHAPQIPIFSSSIFSAAVAIQYISHSSRKLGFVKRTPESATSWVFSQPTAEKYYHVIRLFCLSRFRSTLALAVRSWGARASSTCTSCPTSGPSPATRTSMNG